MSRFSGSVDNYLYFVERAVGRELTHEEIGKLVAMRGCTSYSCRQLADKIKRGKFLWDETKYLGIHDTKKKGGK